MSRICALFASFLLIAFDCAGSTYSCTTLDVPSAPTGINNAGIMVGGGATRGGPGWIRDAAGVVTTVTGQLTTINNSGVAVGFTSSSVFRFDSSGMITDISTLGWPGGVPSAPGVTPVWGISDSGAVSGIDIAANFFILNADGSRTVLGNAALSPSPGSLNTSNLMLENTNVGISGSVSLAAPGVQPFRIGPTDPTSVSNSAYGLNNSGTVVGFAGHNVFGPPSGPPWTGWQRDASGTYSSIICNGLRNIQPYGISDNGIVVGAYTTGPTGFFVATPLPGSAQFQSSLTSLDFGQVPFLQPSAPRPVTITNTGNARMDIGGTAFRGYLPPFTSPSFTATACTANGTAVTSLDPGSSCTINVTEVVSNPFPPPPGSNESDTLVIYDSAPGSPHLIPVSATVITVPNVPAPACSAGSINPGPPRQLPFAFSDVTSGIQTISVVNAVNVTAPVPDFTPGVTTPVSSTVTQIDPQQLASVEYQVTNTAGISATCSAQINGGANVWTGAGVSIQGRPALLQDSSGALNMFVRAPNGNLLHSSESAPGSGFQSFESLGGVLISNPVVMLNTFQGFDVYGIGTDGAVWHTWQLTSGGAWQGWTSIGGSVVGDLQLVLDVPAIYLVARGVDSAVWYNTGSQNGTTWQGWTSLGGYVVSSPAVASFQNGISVLAIGGDGAIWHNDLVNGWSGWASLGGGPFIGQPTAIGGPGPVPVEVYARAADNSLWRNTQMNVPNGTQGQGVDPGWNGWESLGGYFTSDVAVAHTRTEVEIVGRGGDNAIWRTAESFPEGPITGWTSLGGFVTENFSVAADSEQRLEIFAQAPDYTLWGIAQVYPDDWY